MKSNRSRILVALSFICLAGWCVFLSSCSKLNKIGDAILKVADEFESARKDGRYESQEWRKTIKQFQQDLTGTPMENVMHELQTALTEAGGNVIAQADCSAQSFLKTIKLTIEHTAQAIKDQEKKIKEASSDEAILLILQEIAKDVPLPSEICVVNPPVLNLDRNGLLNEKTFSVNGIALPLYKTLNSTNETDDDGLEPQLFLKVRDSEGHERLLKGAVVSYQTRAKTIVDLTRAVLFQDDRQLILSLARSENSGGVVIHMVPIVAERVESEKTEPFTPHAWDFIPANASKQAFVNPFNKTLKGEKFYYERIEKFTGKRNALISWAKKHKNSPIASMFANLDPKKLSGDTEFKGHGPLVHVEGEVHFTPTNINTRLYMWALEWNDSANLPESDFTYAEGWSDMQDAGYSLPAGYQITGVEGTHTSRFTYLDNDHKGDKCEPGSGPVLRFTCIGDNENNDVGRTKVSAEWRELKVKLRRSP